MITVYISVGNSDDKLTQARWHLLYVEANVAIRRAVDAAGGTVHGAWLSEPASAWQNACWCVELNPDSAEHLKMRLADIAEAYRQDSIAWAVAPVTEFIGPREPAGSTPGASE